jgi:aryl-alcohol dehydrogenase-like predicted oxidoreductase
MEYRTLGRTGLRVSSIGLGSGGASMLGQAYGHTRDQARAHVRRALELGINYIDTANAYRDSEELLGHALDGVPRDSYVLSTKYWPERKGVFATAEDVAAAIDESLRRLRLNHVDVFYLHGVAPSVYARCLELYSQVLEAARAAGKVRFFGISEQYGSDFQHEMAQMMVADPIWDVAMIGYNIVGPGAALAALPTLHRHNLGVAIMCAVRKTIAQPEQLTKLIDSWKAEGLLAADAVPSDRPLDWMLGPGCETVADAAHKFAADHPAVSSVLTGTANAAHLEANVAAVLGPRLPADVVQRAIDTFGPVGRNITGE